MGTLRQFINEHRLRMTAELTSENPNMADDEWSRSATHWKCVIKCGSRRMTTYFSQGAAIAGEPDLESVLDCLASDAAGVENARSFEEWCGEYGYDTDSRKAERIYKACEEGAEKLQKLIGDNSAYRELLFETERL